MARPTLFEFAGGEEAFLRLARAHHARCLADPELNAGNGEMGDLPQRFCECFVAALDDAELPADPEFGAAMHAYMRWAVDNVMAYAPADAAVPTGLATPRWSWDGLQT